MLRLTCSKEHSHWREVSVQNSPWESEIKSAVRAAQYLCQIDPQQGYGSRGLQAGPSELRGLFAKLDKQEQWKFCCRRCQKKKAPISGLRGDGTQMFKEVPNDRVSSAFARTAARVKNSTGASAVYEERVRGVLGPPELAKGFFQRPFTTVWTFGRPQNAEPDPRLVLRGRDGR